MALLVCRHSNGNRRVCTWLRDLWRRTLVEGDLSMHTNELNFLDDSLTQLEPIILCEAEQTPIGYTSIGFNVDICGERLRLRIAATDNQVNLTAIVPAAYAVSEQIVQVTLRHHRDSGSKITCHKGCNACCHYLVPITVPEAIKFKADFLTKHPRQQVRILRSSLAASKRILSKRPPEIFATKPTSEIINFSTSLRELSDWFEGLNLSCPFLKEGDCSIYQQRPLTCREHFVAGSNKQCLGQEGQALVVEMPMYISEVLGRLTSELEGTDIESTILPFLPVWWEQNPHRAQQVWPASVMVEHFVMIIEEMTAKRSVMPIQPN